MKKKLSKLELNKKTISALNSKSLSQIVGASGDICQTVPRMSACTGPCPPKDATKGCPPIIIGQTEIICG